MSGTNTDEAPDRAVPSSSTVAGRRLVAVDAFIDLVLESGSPPTPDDIADRAGVSRATFFRYFATLHELRGEAATRVLERFPDLFTIPAIGTGSRDERVRNFVDARFRLHETLHALELVTRSHAFHDAETAEFVDAVRHVFVDQARQQFEIDLQPYGPAHRDDVVTAIAVLTSVESWQQFRHSHNRSPVQTRRAWRHALVGILTDRSGESPRRGPGAGNTATATRNNGGGRHAT